MPLSVARRSILNPEVQSLNCFQFFQFVFKNFKKEWEQLCTLHTDVQKDLPEKHRSSDMIPYHLALIVEALEKGMVASSFFSPQLLSKACVGDIFIYIDPAYDPDPTNRNIPPGTHVGFIDEIIMKENEDIQLRLIDASSRRKARFSDLSDPEGTKLKKSSVGYSQVVLEKSEKEGLWKCIIPGLGKPMRRIYILRWKKEADETTNIQDKKS